MTKQQVDDALRLAGCIAADVQPATVHSGYLVGNRDGEVVVCHWIPSAWEFAMTAIRRKIERDEYLTKYRIALQRAGIDVATREDHLMVL